MALKREDIPNLTPEQCADELTLQEVKKLLQKARKKAQQTAAALREVYDAMEDMCIDLDAPTEAENADTLEHAIDCYVQYGEYSLNGLMKEIRMQYTRSDQEE